MPKKPVRHHLHHCAKSLGCVTGVVLIWSGIGIFLDYVQTLFFIGREPLLGVLAIIGGVLILYLPDKDLDELG
jgi:hypothetical protein